MIRKGSQQIESLDDWRVHAGPKTPDQWVDHRSAKESARAWLREGSAGIPSEIRALLASHPDFSEIARWEAEPEARVRFDSFRGESSNLDVLLRAEDSSGSFIVGVEAKADETFSVILSDARRSAEKRLEQNPRSKGVERLELLLGGLFGGGTTGEIDLADLRYQLCTATAAVLSEADRTGSDRAVLVIHEFVTSKTEDRLHRENAADLDRFLACVSRGRLDAIRAGELHGPIVGPWTDESRSAPRLYVGKAVCLLRDST